MLTVLVPAGVIVYESGLATSAASVAAVMPRSVVDSIKLLMDCTVPVSAMPFVLTKITVALAWPVIVPAILDTSPSLVLFRYMPPELAKSSVSLECRSNSFQVNIALRPPLLATSIVKVLATSSDKVTSPGVESVTIMYLFTVSPVVV